jgi:hypothetical protein
MSSRLLMIVVCAVAMSIAMYGEKDEKLINAAIASDTTANPAGTATVSAGQQSAQVGLDSKQKPSAATTTAAKDVKPPANAKQATSIGEDQTAITRANPSFVWTQEVDYDNDGTVEETDYLYDPVDKMTFLYVEDDFNCAGGTGRGSGGILIAVYNEGNKLGKPAGSGWYVAELDKGECNAQAAALWGCKFDANANPTVCGLVTAQVQDDIVIVAQKSN